MKIIVGLLVLGIFILSGCSDNSDSPVACTMDAKVCSDGSAVGRVGPNCEFESCPETEAECSVDSDCVPDACCHAKGCVAASGAPSCDRIMCTMNCEPGTLDCGGSCSCNSGKCTAILEGLN